MCQYCDEKALPCLMCGRACMEYQLDRTRCRRCATAHRPPDVWPVFRFCPYCGRDLEKNENQNENQNQGEEEMARLIWTNEMDETVRRMEADGASDEEICEALGIKWSQLMNRRYNLQYRERKSCEEVTEACEPEVKLEPKGELTPFERDMARMIEEREKMLMQKEEENRRLRSENHELMVCIESFRDRIRDMGQQIERKDRVIGKMAEQIYGELT